jgi:mRNA-degrading endonuclease toxin of MazEF toxin-antitoxin module
LDDCPPLEGHVVKRRPVIIVSPADRLGTDVLVLVVATSTTALSSEIDRVALPSLEDEPQTNARLPKKCWAVPQNDCVTLPAISAGHYFAELRMQC